MSSSSKTGTAAKRVLVFVSYAKGLEDECRAIQEEFRWQTEKLAVQGGELRAVVRERTPSWVSRTSYFDEDLARCDFFVWVAGAQMEYLTMEYFSAVECLYDPLKPMRQMALFFKPPEDPKLLGSDQDAFQRVDEHSRLHLYGFEEVGSLRKQLREELVRWTMGPPISKPLLAAPLAAPYSPSILEKTSVNHRFSDSENSPEKTLLALSRSPFQKALASLRAFALLAVTGGLLLSAGVSWELLYPILVALILPSLYLASPPASRHAPS